jgi:hypothetical protein
LGAGAHRMDDHGVVSVDAEHADLEQVAIAGGTDAHDDKIACQAAFVKEPCQAVWIKMVWKTANVPLVQAFVLAVPQGRFERSQRHRTPARCLLRGAESKATLSLPGK